MERQEMEKWSERYFQLCLALIQRPSFSNYGLASPVNIRDVMNKADLMLVELQRRDRVFFAKCEKSDSNVSK